MTLEFQNQWFDKLVDPNFIRPLPRERLTRVGPNTLRENLFAHGYLEWWLDRPGKPGPYHGIFQQGARVEQNERVEQIDSWAEYSAAQKRTAITDQIERQVADGSARQFVEDPELARNIEITSGGASERKSDLEDTPDVDLDSFAPDIFPTPVDGAGFIEARMVTWIDRIEPWAGAPDDDLALYVTLEILGSGDPAAGVDARAHMYDHDGVDQGILPFTQDATNPNIWRTNSQLGRYWADETQAAQMRLYWNSGSLPVAETRQIEGYGDRQSAIIRAPV